jgi:hypothetical protein
MLYITVLKDGFTCTVPVTQIFLASAFFYGKVRYVKVSGRLFPIFYFSNFSIADFFRVYLCLIFHLWLEYLLVVVFKRKHRVCTYKILILMLKMLTETILTNPL